MFLGYIEYQPLQSLTFFIIRVSWNDYVNLYGRREEDKQKHKWKANILQISFWIIQGWLSKLHFYWNLLLVSLWNLPFIFFYRICFDILYTWALIITDWHLTKVLKVFCVNSRYSLNLYWAYIFPPLEISSPPIYNNLIIDVNFLYNNLFEKPVIQYPQVWKDYSAYHNKVFQSLDMKHSQLWLVNFVNTKVDVSFFNFFF